MDSELPSFLVWLLCIKCLVHHEVYSVSWSCLLSFLCNPYIPFLIYKKIYLLVSSRTPVKKTTESATALSYLDVLITIDNGRYSTAVFNKRDSFTFNIVNFPHLSSNIPSKPAYGVYISQLVRIGRICSNFVQLKLNLRPFHITP